MAAGDRQVTLQSGGAVTLPTKLAETTLDKFVGARLGDQELSTLRTAIIDTKFQQGIEQQLKNKKPYEAIRVTPTLYRSQFPRKTIPRNLVVFKNHLGQQQWIVELKSKVAGGKPVAAVDKKAMRVGRGGFRTVKYAVDVFTNNILAVTASKSSQKVQFQEAQILFHLNNLFVIKPLAYLQHQDKKNNWNNVTISPYYERGIVSARQIYDYTLQQRTRLVIQMLMGIKALHDKGLVHNDIKPGNTLVAAGGEARIIDLDGAKRAFPAKNGTYTPDYAAPEVHQVVSKDYPNALGSSYKNKINSVAQPFNTKPSDIWSLGIAVYQLAHVGRDRGRDSYHFVMPNEKFIDAELSQQTTLLDRLAHKMLRPEPDKRVDIDAAINFLMLEITKENLQKIVPQLPRKKKQSIFKKKEKALEVEPIKFASITGFVNKAFSGYEDLFWTLPKKTRVELIGLVSKEFSQQVKVTWSLDNYIIRDADKKNSVLIKEFVLEKKTNLNLYLADIKQKKDPKELLAFFDAIFVHIDDQDSANDKIIAARFYKQVLEEFDDSFDFLFDYFHHALSRFVQNPNVFPDRFKLTLLKRAALLTDKGEFQQVEALPVLFSEIETLLTVEQDPAKQAELAELTLQLLSTQLPYVPYYEVISLVLKISPLLPGKINKLSQAINQAGTIANQLTAGLENFLRNISQQDVKQFAKFLMAVKQQDPALAKKILLEFITTSGGTDATTVLPIIKKLAVDLTVLTAIHELLEGENFYLLSRLQPTAQTLFNDEFDAAGSLENQQKIIEKYKSTKTEELLGKTRSGFLGVKAYLSIKQKALDEARQIVQPAPGAKK